MSSCTGSSVRKQGHLGMRGRGMGGLMQQRTSAREVHARKLPSKTALVTGGQPWQRSFRNLWGQKGPNSPGSLRSPLGFAPAELLGGTGHSPSPPSHLHVLLCCDLGEHRQFLLINVSASAVPPIPFLVLSTFRS